MGNSAPKEREEGQIEYDRLGLVTVKQIEDTQGGDKIPIMELSRSIDSEKTYREWVEGFRGFQDPDSRQVFLLPQKHSFEKAGMCGSNGFVHLTFENFPFVLQSQIQNRKRLGRYFLETEMWYLLYNIIRAGNKFEKIKKKMGDVSPHNILINDDGQIKVLSTISLPSELNNFQKIVQNKNAPVFLAPEELDSQIISKGEYPENIDPCRADVFSIGLTILSSGILEDCFQVYENSRVNEERLRHFQNIFRQKYSNYLSSTVISMLSMMPSQRRKASDIYNQLYPNENQILDLEPFPDKMRNSVGQQQYQQPMQPYPQQSRPVSYQPQTNMHPYYENRQTSGQVYQSYAPMNQQRR